MAEYVVCDTPYEFAKWMVLPDGTAIVSIDYEDEYLEAQKKAAD